MTCSRGASCTGYCCRARCPHSAWRTPRPKQPPAKITRGRSDGIPPDDLQIIDFTRQLLRKNRIDEPLAQAVMARLGADQDIQLTTCIGYYAMLAMTVNGVGLPPNPKHEALKA
jgi:hypothetical protein